MPSAAFYERALRAAAGLQSARRGGWTVPDSAIDAINEALRDGDEEWAFKLVVQARDHLCDMFDAADAGSDAWLLRSRQVDDLRYDTLLCALVEHEFATRRCRQAPQWAERGLLVEQWVQPNARWGEEWTRRCTPGWLSARNIFISDRDLATA